MAPKRGSGGAKGKGLTPKKRVKEEEVVLPVSPNSIGVGATSSGSGMGNHEPRLLGPAPRPSARAPIAEADSASEGAGGSKHVRGKLRPTNEALLETILARLDALESRSTTSGIKEQKAPGIIMQQSGKAVATGLPTPVWARPDAIEAWPCSSAMMEQRPASSSAKVVQQLLSSSVKTEQRVSGPLAVIHPKAIPSDATSDPLGFHLLPETKERIWKGEYVDMFSLLYREVLPHQRKVERLWDNWLSGFHIYASVIIQKELTRSLSLLKYMDIIHRAHTEYSGIGWLQYDEAFRMWAASDPTLPWDRRAMDLWLQFMLPFQAIPGDRADSGHILVRFANV